MVRRSAALALAVALASPAAAQSFLQREGHWMVFASGIACQALNRPPEEFNYAPYNALSLRQRRDAPLRLQLFAWPGVFKAGAAVELSVAVDGWRFELPATAGDSYFAETTAPLPADLPDRLRRGKRVEIGFGGPQRLLFDVSQLGAVLTQFDACMAQLPKG